MTEKVDVEDRASAFGLADAGTECESVEMGVEAWVGRRYLCRMFLVLGVELHRPLFAESSQGG